jgi:glycosyltransferase involved in cell wall biosynthesis
MKNLLVTPATPNLQNGRGVRTYGVTAALARHGPVEVAYVVFEGSRPGREYDTLAAVNPRPINASRGAGRALEYLRARLRGVPSGLARGVSPELARGADGADDGVRVIADGPTAAAALLPLARRRDVVYLAHNFESGFRELGRGDTARFERQLLRTFAETWMPTRTDIEQAIELAGEQVSPRYVPNVVDTEQIAAIVPSDQPRVVLVGDFSYEANREALAFLAKQVMPLLWACRPDVRLTVAGRGVKEHPGDERTEVVGFVEDLGSFYQQAAVVAVPLLHGGGSPLKFIDALARGLPVVATAHAARLLEEGVAGEHFLAATSPLEFAEAVDELLGDRGRAATLGTAGRELIARSYSVDALATLLAP